MPYKPTGKPNGRPKGSGDFWSKVQKTNTCWNWTASGTRGYGLFWFEDKLRYAHRVSAYLAGIITSVQDTRVVLHICDNRKCVNPAHLQAGTQMDNMLDMMNKNRQHSKLNPDTVRAIRKDHRVLRLIAADYDVSIQTISSIKRLQTWRHIT